MSFCTNCGNQIQDGMRFCPACGFAVAVPQPYMPPVQEEIPQYTAPVQEEVPQYTAPVQEEIPQYTAPVQEEIPQYTAPIQQVQTEYTDDDLDMEGPPIVGNYTIPGVEATKPAAKKEKKQSVAGSKLPIMIGAAALVIALVVCGVIFIPRMLGAPKADGEGTALRDLLDDTAAYHYLGAGDNTSETVNEDE